MSKLKKEIKFETTFGEYIAYEIIGEGGAGRVYGGKNQNNDDIAIKLLHSGPESIERRKRFKNEINFLQQNKHKNIVTVIDHGIVSNGSKVEPFCVMPRFTQNLRKSLETQLDDKGESGVR
jgi:serine/threonine protein kinase